MIEKINSWIGQIIIATVISIIIQMIIPDGKNKKYVEVIGGLYVLYVILNPILNLDKNYSISEIKSTIASSYENTMISKEEIARTYILGLENNLKIKIEEFDYQVDYIQFYITTDYKSIEKIDVKMKLNTNFDKEKIIKIVLDNFEINKDNINII